jgi:predicted tellurium resistance membrane protein TerC
VDFAIEFTPDLAVAFLTLFVLEIVLGVDNVIFISILASKLPVEQQAKARNLGLALGMRCASCCCLRPPGSSR